MLGCDATGGAPPSYFLIWKLSTDPEAYRRRISCTSAAPTLPPPGAAGYPFPFSFSQLSRNVTVRL